MLHLFPNGDWRRSDCVEVYHRPGSAADKRVVALLTCKALSLFLAANAFTIFNRGRWTQNDVAVNQLGLLQMCDCLLERTFRRWLRKVGHTQGGPPQVVHDGGHFVSGGCDAVALDGGDTERRGDIANIAPASSAELTRALGDPRAGDALADMSSGPSPAREAGGDISPGAWAEQNSSNRDIALRWFDDSPAGTFCSFAS